MLESLGLPTERDYATFPWLGNTGSVALPITLALAIESGFIGRQGARRPARHRQRDQLRDARRRLAAIAGHDARRLPRLTSPCRVRRRP